MSNTAEGKKKVNVAPYTYITKSGKKVKVG
jgi:hypothetical protein